MTTRQLLLGGVLGAALFVVAFSILGAVRMAYDPVPHFISILSLGDGGWMQITNFVLGGGLIACLGVGLARRWASGPGGRWVPRLIVIAGVALAGCGVFVPDPSLGYPPGTPNELVTPLTWHGAIHYACATTIGLSLSAAVLLSIRRGFALGERWLALASAGVAVAVVVTAAVVIVASLPDPTRQAGLIERVGVYGGWAWLVIVGAVEARRIPST